MAEKQKKHNDKNREDENVMTRDAESLAIARYHYEMNKTFQVISEDYIHKDIRTLSKIMNEGRERWWNITVSPELELLQIDLDKEKAIKLRQIFGLQRCIVVKCTNVDDAHNDKYKHADRRKEEEAALASDMLHVQLAMATANHLAQKLNNNNLRVGLASGRAVTYAAFFLYRHRNNFEELKNVVGMELYSLSGRQYDFRWSRNSNTALDILPVNLDANNAVSYLAHALGISGNKTHLVTWPISCSDQNMRNLFPPYLKAKPPQLSIAVLGLGVVNTRHHYYSHPEGLEPLHDDLRKLKQFQNEDPRLLSSILEICHYLFLAGKHENSEKIQEVINSINEKIVSIDWEAIRNANETIIIAGGAQKARALASFSQIHDPNFPIDPERTTLITDSWTADEMIKMGDNELGTEKKQRDKQLVVKQ